MTAVVVIPGEPVAFSHRTAPGGRHRYIPQTQRIYMSDVLNVARAMNAGVQPSSGPVRVSVEAVHGVPNSWSKPKRAAAFGRPKTSKPDVTNISKICIDALIGWAFVDDAQVVEEHNRKRWCREGEQPHVRVEIEEVTT